MTHTSDFDLAVRALRAGDRGRARQLFTRLLTENPRQAKAWLALSLCLDDPERQRYCLQRALALQPDLTTAREALNRLDHPIEAPIAVRPAVGLLESPHPETSNIPAEPAAPTPVPVMADSASAPPAAIIPASPAPARPRRRRFTTLQFILLGLLLLTALAAIGGLITFTAPSLAGAGIDWPRLAFWELYAPSQQNIPSPVDPAAAPPTRSFQFESTWTPTAPYFSLTDTPHPTLNIFGGVTATPIASLTPIPGHRRINIGRSVEGRALEVVRFGGGRKERMIIAGIHGGDEYNTIALADQIIEHLVQNPNRVPSGITLYILRALNPDGAARARDVKGRLNANGVDLNRNFDTNWKSSWVSEGCASAPGTSGSGPGSEPETQAVKDFLSKHRVEALINYHSAGLGVFPSGSPPHPESTRLARAIADMSNYAFPPVDTGCEYTGTLVDWAGEHGVLAAVDLELNAVRSTEFEINVKVLDLLLRFDVDRPLPSSTPNANRTPFATP